MTGDGSKRVRILLTGATGFIGSHLTPRLVDKNYEVFLLQRYVTGRSADGRSVRGTVVSDLRDYFSVRKMISEIQPEVIIHLAALSPVAYSYDHPQEVLAVNTLGTVNLAEAALREIPHFRQFIFAGTSEEYGTQDEFPIKETAVLKANSPYSASKIAADQYLCYLRDAYDFPITVMRCFNTFGRKQDTNFVIEHIITQLLKSPVIHLGDTQAQRDFMYVEDHVQAYLTCLENPRAVGETFNFCTGQVITIQCLAQLIGELVGSEPDIASGATAPRPLDIAILHGDNSQARRILDWRPMYTLEEGLKLTVEYWKTLLGSHSA